MDENDQTAETIVGRRVMDTRLAYLERRQEKFEEKLDKITELLTWIRNTGMVIGFILSPSTFAQLMAFTSGGTLPTHPQYQQPVQPPQQIYPRGTENQPLPPRP